MYLTTPSNNRMLWYLMLLRILVKSKRLRINLVLRILKLLLGFVLFPWSLRQTHPGVFLLADIYAVFGTRANPLFATFVVFRGISQLITLTRISADFVARRGILPGSVVMPEVGMLGLRPLLLIMRVLTQALEMLLL